MDPLLFPVMLLILVVLIAVLLAHACVDLGVDLGLALRTITEGVCIIGIVNCTLPWVVHWRY
jgi:hypothetical protein